MKRTKARKDKKLGIRRDIVRTLGTLRDVELKQVQGGCDTPSLTTERTHQNGDI